MPNSDISAINKIIIPVNDSSETYPHILWMNGACDETKYTLNLKPHNHTFFEVHFVIEGSIVYSFDSGNVEVERDHLILIPPHKIHCITEHSEKFQKITVAFDLSESGDVFNALSSRKNKAIVMSDDIKDSLSFIIKKAKNKTPYAEELIKNRLYEIICMIAESANVKATSSLTRPYDTRITKAKKFIEDNPHLFMTCDEVAQFCHLSSKQLGRLFREFENISLLSFIHGQKIEDAKRMVRDTDMLFEEISERLGFSSVNYFGKFFTKHMGVTPGEYRKTQNTDK